MPGCAHLYTMQMVKVTVPGFYDDVKPPEKWERDELSKLPITEAEYSKFLGISEFFPPPGFLPWRVLGFARLWNLMGLEVATREKAQRR